MYFPYLRGKQFELQALLGVSPAVYSNTLPIVEPVKITGANYPASYNSLAQRRIPLILVTNPQAGDLSSATVQTALIDGRLQAHPDLTLGFLVTQRFSVADLDGFLGANPMREKVIIFRFSPDIPTLNVIAARIQRIPVKYVIFDERKAGAAPVMAAFAWHTGRVILSDGFQRQERNADYPPNSAFYSYVDTRASMGMVGFGDYLTIGDIYREGGGPVYVVALHMTVPGSSGIASYHFTSISNPGSPGIPGPKFLEAGNAMINSVAASTLLPSTGLAMYSNWVANSHYPGLGQAKQASIQHHIEVMSSLV